MVTFCSISLPISIFSWMQTRMLLLVCLRQHPLACSILPRFLLIARQKQTRMLLLVCLRQHPLACSILPRFLLIARQKQTTWHSRCYFPPSWHHDHHCHAYEPTWRTCLDLKIPSHRMVVPCHRPYLPPTNDCFGHCLGPPRLASPSWLPIASFAPEPVPRHWPAWWPPPRPLAEYVRLRASFHEGVQRQHLLVELMKVHRLMTTRMRRHQTLINRVLQSLPRTLLLWANCCCCCCCWRLHSYYWQWHWDSCRGEIDEYQR